LGHPENSEWVSIISVIIFAVNIVDEQKQTYLVTIFVLSFHCPQLFYCSPCPTAAPASLNMHVVSTNFAKTLICKREYDVILWRHKERISNNNDHYTPMLNTRIWKGGIQSSSRPGHHQSSARHWLHLWKVLHQQHKKTVDRGVCVNSFSYFNIKLRHQDKAWVPHEVCTSCVEILWSWSHEKDKHLPFGIPMIWRIK